MNLDWTNLTNAQKRALAILCQEGPSPLSMELGEQLINLGLAERSSGMTFSVSPLGATVPPAALN